MRNIIAGLFLVIVGCGVAGYGWYTHQSLDTVSKASSLVSQHLLAFEQEPNLDLSSYLARGEEAEKALAADLLQIESADWSGAEEKKDAAMAFTTRALSVIRTYTRFLMSSMRLDMTKQRLQEDERALAQETDPKLKSSASERLQAYKEKYQQEWREFYHQNTAIGMHCEMLLRANDEVKVAFGDDKGLDLATQAFMKQLF
ncbi:hypothetical protein SB766_15100 [Pseudomonas sp. SIMBA_077]